MLDPFVLSNAFAAAALVAAAVVLVLSRWRCSSCGGALAVLAGWYAGLWMLGQLPHVPPREDVDRLLVIVLPAALVAELLAEWSARVGWLCRLLIAGVAMPVILSSSSYVTDLAGPGTREWTSYQALAIFAGAAACLALVWLSLIRLAKQAAPASVLIALSIACIGAAVTIMLSGYATGGQLAVPLAAAIAGAALASIRRGSANTFEGALGVGLVGLFSLLVIGRLSAGLTTLNAVLLFFAPTAGWLTIAAKRRNLFAVLLTSIPVAAALFMAQQKFAADSVRSTTNPAEPGINDYLQFGK